MIDKAFLDEILKNAPIFLLLWVRALGLIETAPLFSSGSIPQAAKFALAGCTAYCVFPAVAGEAAWNALPGLAGGLFGLGFLVLLAGEALIGIIIGFFMTIVFAAFSTAGQFFSLQMGFGASEAFDPLSQIENPLMGQFLNIVAMLTFLVIGGFRDLFLAGFWRSVQALSVADLVRAHEAVIFTMAGGLSKLFLDALMLSMPILGTLFLISLTTGLISKAAPQINILAEGFPLSIGIAFIVIMATLPFMVDAFNRVLTGAFNHLAVLLTTRFAAAP
jgi:flagellar biosynthetic protein FliR